MVDMNISCCMGEPVDLRAGEVLNLPSNMIHVFFLVINIEH